MLILQAVGCFLVVVSAMLKAKNHEDWGWFLAGGVLCVAFGALGHYAALK